MPQAQSLRDHPLFEPLRSERGRRVVGLIAALLIEAILLIVLLTLNIHDEPDAAPGSLTVVDLKAQDDSPDESEQAEQKPSESAPQFEQRTEPSDPQIERPEAVQPDIAPTQPVPQPVIPTPFQLPSRQAPPRPAQPRGLPRSRGWSAPRRGTSGPRDCVSERRGAPEGHFVGVRGARRFRGFLSDVWTS